MKKHLLLLAVGSMVCFAAAEEYEITPKPLSKETIKLMDAVKKGDVILAEQAIKEGAEMNVPGRTPLWQAAANGDEKMVALLLKHGASVDYHDASEVEGGLEMPTALMKAAHKGLIPIMRLLIDAGADVNRVAWDDFPSEGTPVLRYAIASGSPEAVRMLIKAGADTNVFTHHGFSHKRKKAEVRGMPLLSSAIRSRAPIKIIDKLIAGGADVNKRALSAHLSVPVVKPEFPEATFAKPAPVEWTPLMIAAYTGYPEAVKKLLESGADKTIKNTQDGGRTALDYAKEKKHKNIILLFQDQKPKKLQDKKSRNSSRRRRRR